MNVARRTSGSTDVDLVMGLKMSVGTELRTARERRGMSLAVLAANTKIRVVILQSMESGDFDRLPGGLFTRGFLRAYAREVGLDPEETVEQYLVEFEPPPPVEPTDEITLEDDDIGPAEMEELERRSQRKQLVGGAVVLLIGPLLYFTFLGRHSGGTSAVVPQSPPPEAAIPSKTEVGTTGTPDETMLAPAGTDRWAGTLHLEIQPTAPCWMSAIADGRQGPQRLMNAGDRETIDATDEVTLRVGDPATCMFSINGASARPTGSAGRPATLRITRQNYMEFLNPASSAAAGASRAEPSTRRAANPPSAAARISLEPVKASRSSVPPPPTSPPSSRESTRRNTLNTQPQR